MPSKSRGNFEKFLLKDVNGLIELYKEKYSGRGRPQSVLNRSGIFLLCAAWELYCEDLIVECSEKILSACPSPSEFPEELKKTLANHIKNEKNDLYVLTLSGDGWKSATKRCVQQRVGSLNTPSASKLIDLFSALIGANVAPVLTPASERLQLFISKRGDIAHRGADAGHVSISDLESDYKFICDLVADLDNSLVDIMQQITKKRPWNKSQNN